MITITRIASGSTSTTTSKAQVSEETTIAIHWPFSQSKEWRKSSFGSKAATAYLPAWEGKQIHLSLWPRASSPTSMKEGLWLRRIKGQNFWVRSWARRLCYFSNSRLRDLALVDSRCEPVQTGYHESERGRLDVIHRSFPSCRIANMANRCSCPVNLSKLVGFEILERSLVSRYRFSWPIIIWVIPCSFDTVKTV